MFISWSSKYFNTNRSDFWGEFWKCTEPCNLQLCCTFWLNFACVVQIHWFSDACSINWNIKSVKWAWLKNLDHAKRFVAHVFPASPTILIVCIFQRKETHSLHDCFQQGNIYLPKIIDQVICQQNLFFFFINHLLILITSGKTTIVLIWINWSQYV